MSTYIVLYPVVAFVLAVVVGRTATVLLAQQNNPSV